MYSIKDKKTVDGANIFDRQNLCVFFFFKENSKSIEKLNCSAICFFLLGNILVFAAFYFN